MERGDRGSSRQVAYVLSQSRDRKGALAGRSPAACCSAVRKRDSRPEFEMIAGMFGNWRIAVIFLAVQGLAAQDKAASAPSQQALLDAQLDTMLRQSDQAQASGNHALAAKGLEDALLKVRSQALLAKREDNVLTRLAGVYMASQRPAEAVPKRTPRPLRDPRAHRRGRDGRGVPRARSQAEP